MRSSPTIYIYIHTYIQTRDVQSPCFSVHKLNLDYGMLASGSRDSVVGIATGYELDDRGVRVKVPVEAEIFSTSSRPALGPTQPSIQWVTGALPLVVKRMGREADHSPPN
jgi:hypothetical protein